jgi:hypothetical protein
VVALVVGFASLPDAPAQSTDPAAWFSFAAAGDMGWSPDALATVTALKSSGADFFLHLGDFAYDQIAPETAWCDFVKKAVGESFPYQLVAGGHDMNQGQGDINNYAACLPDHMHSTGTYAKQYYFDHPADHPLARVIMISPSMPFAEGTYDYSVGSPHYQWLVDAIDGARAAGIPWVVVGMARDCISAGEKWCEIGADVFNLLVDKRVDLVLQGHEHGYERSKQLASGPDCPAIPLNQPAGAACIADDGADGVYTKGNGPIVVVAGTAGIDMRPMNATGKDPEAADFVKLMGISCGAGSVAPCFSPSTKGFMQYTVTPTQLQARFVRTAKGGFADSFTIEGGSSSPPPAVTPFEAPPPTTTTSGPAAPATPPPSVASTGPSGYWLLGTDGHVYPLGDAAPLGSPDGLLPAGSTAVDVESTPSGHGYWIVDDAGEVFAYGDAPGLGGADRSRLAAGETVTSLSGTPSGGGYWLFTDRGRALPFGDARFLGDVSGLKLNGPVLDSVPTPSGKGYYMVASDGGIFAFGDAAFEGSMGDHKLNAPVQSLVPDPDRRGYWLVASDGGVFAFDAPFRGSMGGAHLNQPVTGMIPYGDGYLMVATDGGVFDFSDRPYTGSLGDHPPARPITAVTALP